MSETATCQRVTFEIDGQPLPKQRPRVRNGRAYTPSKTRAYESRVAWLARAEMGPREPMTGNVCVDLQFRRKGDRRADLDNMCKAVLDGLNGIVYNDDYQVTGITAGVEYGARVPGVRVICEEVKV